MKNPLERGRRADAQQRSAKNKKKKKTKGAFTFNLALYPRFKMVPVCVPVYARVCVRVCVVVRLMHANEPQKRQLYLISINGRTVQKGLPHTHARRR